MDAVDIRQFVATAPIQPGIYQFIDQANQTLYVGKAKNLKKRLGSYARVSQPAKTQLMLPQAIRIETTITRTENEALILENNLIKQLKPRYNVLLRDDKSYPYIFLSAHKDYPRLTFHRGPQREKGRYFGPFPGVHAVRENLDLLQKLFRVRQCKDTFFKNRSRPCLQYQINHCTAPCVKLISPEEYAEDVRHTAMFLAGDTQVIVDELVKGMQAASDVEDFEMAARYRDQVQAIRELQERQYVQQDKKGNIDVIALVRSQGLCIQILTIRHGQLLGNRSYYPSNIEESTDEEIMFAFVSQYYLGTRADEKFPSQIVLNQSPQDQAWLQKSLEVEAHKKIKMIVEPRGDAAKWLSLAKENALASLARHKVSAQTFIHRLELLQEVLDLPSIPESMECFDVSHTQGQETVASCVVFTNEGPNKSAYRRFNIVDITPGDDYAALRQALIRRYTHVKFAEEPVPDIIFIDGGRGQLNKAQKALEDMQLTAVTLIAVAKGEGRKPGLETLWIAGQTGRRPTPLRLSADSPALHIVQFIRDEAHRFAIMGHRKRRGKDFQRSPLEQVEGIGPKRRKQLLTQLGGLQGVKEASIETLMKVPGISRALAEKIYKACHP